MDAERVDLIGFPQGAINETDSESACRKDDPHDRPMWVMELNW